MTFFFFLVALLTWCYVAAFITPPPSPPITAEIGDYDDLADRDFLKLNKLLPNQERIQERIMELHYRHLWVATSFCPLLSSHPVKLTSVLAWSQTCLYCTTNSYVYLHDSDYRSWQDDTNRTGTRLSLLHTQSVFISLLAIGSAISTLYWRQIYIYIYFLSLFFQCFERTWKVLFV